ncbi:hypothetical protein [Geothrix sp. PMB-07]|uniref:hypothetical protein n=1 Tax=Geothrix sp. PMB-07 TaxID=3068640 RepID=UPI0027411784|nr:hypothetical protein [Geothrix sp. PMB-07]WLT33582.1 hypothetical protein Q9293_10620 [Geothrix sp. PMB-07]
MSDQGPNEKADFHFVAFLTERHPALEFNATARCTAFDVNRFQAKSQGDLPEIPGFTHESGPVT